MIDRPAAVRALARRDVTHEYVNTCKMHYWCARSMIDYGGLLSNLFLFYKNLKHKTVHFNCQDNFSLPNYNLEYKIWHKINSFFLNFLSEFCNWNFEKKIDWRDFSLILNSNYDHNARVAAQVNRLIIFRGISIGLRKNAGTQKKRAICPKRFFFFGTFLNIYNMVAFKLRARCVLFRWGGKFCGAERIMDWRNSCWGYNVRD